MKKFLFFGAAALLALGAASCSNNDDLFVDRNKPVDSDQSFYVNIDINTTDALTRAVTDDPNYTYDPTEDPSFNAGTGGENKVSTIYLIFYDKEKNRVATTQVRRENGQQGSGRNDSENSLYKGVVQIDIKHGSLPPAYVMCFINPITSQNFEINPDFASMYALEHSTRSKIIDNNDNFAMSKSVYYGYDRTKAPEDQIMEKIIATPIGDGQLFKTVEEAREALDNDEQNDNPSMVDIYVERYAVKVNFKVEDAAETDIMVDGKKLTFVPEYWAVNAYESDTYVCKSFFQMDKQTNLSYDDLQTAFGNIGDNKNGWKWNNTNLHRCYWAQTPAYYSANYPRVADDILDKLALSNTGSAGYALGYYSYNDMVSNYNGEQADNWTTLSRKARSLQDDQDKVRPIYARENTVSGASLLAAYNDPLASPKAAIGSVVMVGRYQIDGHDIPENQTFYVMGNATNGYTFFENESKMIDYFTNITLPFATNKNGTPFFKYGVTENDGVFSNEEYKKYFTITHPYYSSRTLHLDESSALVVDSRFVTIQLNRAEVFNPDNEELPLYAYLDGEYTKVTADNFDEINQQMFYMAGTVQGFQGGKAYFTIPIKHLGYYRADNPNLETAVNSKNFDWTGVRSGDFGLVRNHIYNIVVDNIKGLGNGIPDPDDPIVPPTDPEEYFIGARIIVLNWALVPTQNETL